MFFEACLVDEAHVCGEDVFCWLIVERVNEESNHAFGDEGVGVGMVGDFIFWAILFFGIKPDLGLATLDEFFWGLGGFCHGREIFSEADDVFVALGPVLEEAEVFEEFSLCFGDSHFY